MRARPAILKGIEREAAAYRRTGDRAGIGPDLTRYAGLPKEYLAEGGHPSADGVGMRA